MIRSALLFCAAAIVATCFACALPSPPASVAKGPVCDFAGKVRWIDTPSFMPHPGDQPPPSTSLPTPVPGTIPDYAKDMGAAFAAASYDFQKQLCSLDGVYINGAACTSSEQCSDDSWGWKQSQPKPVNSNGRLIALSKNLWTLSASPTYSDYETQLMGTVLPSDTYYSGAASCASSGACNCNSGSCTSIDNFSTALLAALAHEVGHIRYYELVNPTFASFAPTDPTTFCKGAFYGGSWSGPVHNPPPWRSLSTPQKRQNNRRMLIAHGLSEDSHKMPPDIADIDTSGNDDDRATKIHLLLGPTQPWASEFAAVSADEDFVETYKFAVLTTAVHPLKWAKITIPHYPHGSSTDVNVANDYWTGNKPGLAEKVRCILNVGI
jgi:hypothetical protein